MDRDTDKRDQGNSGGCGKSEGPPLISRTDACDIVAAKDE